MQDICTDYATGKNVTHVLRNVNLTVEEGDYLAIMGPSGSGKTTLMNLLGFLDVPTSGTYRFAGHDMARSTDNQLADVRNRDIGFVFQSFNLLPKLTALDNAALPLLYRGVPKAERREMALEALKTVGLEDRVNHLPTELSGGQCQRVAIARAIVGSPKLLLADEPTGALDSESGRMILDIFASLHAKGATIIMITHDHSVASHAERIVHIYDGVLTDNVLAGGEKVPSALGPGKLTEPEDDAPELHPERSEGEPEDDALACHPERSEGSQTDAEEPEDDAPACHPERSEGSQTDAEELEGGDADE